MAKEYLVYLIIKGRKVVYVGHTFNLRTRLQLHKVKDFDRVKRIQCTSKAQALDMEKKLIKKHSPEFNYIKPKGDRKAVNVKVSKEAIRKWHLYALTKGYNKETAMEQILLGLEL